MNRGNRVDPGNLMVPLELEQELAQLLEPLSAEQLRFFAIRLQVTSDAEAARQTGLHPDTVLSWKHSLRREHGIDLDEIRKATAREGVITAFEILRRAAPKAAQVFVDGLDDEDKWIRLQSAREVAERLGVRQSEVVEIGVTDKLAQILRRNMAPWTQETDSTVGITDIIPNETTIEAGQARLLPEPGRDTAEQREETDTGNG